MSKKKRQERGKSANLSRIYYLQVDYTFIRIKYSDLLISVISSSIKFIKREPVSVREQCSNTSTPNAKPPVKQLVLIKLNCKILYLQVLPLWK